jgi:restriction system protein
MLWECPSPNSALLRTLAGLSAAKRARSLVGRASLRPRPTRISFESVQQTLFVKQLTPASMSVPTFQDLTLPLLRLAADGRTRSLAEAREVLGSELSLTEAELEEMLPSGRQARFANRVAWAKVYLERGGLVSSPSRGQFVITARGRAVLASPPARISIKFLEQYPEFAGFRTRRSRPEVDDGDEEAGLREDAATPEEALEAAYQKIRDRIAAELLERVKAASPKFFEQLVVDLLVKMGYGGSRKGAGEAIGRAGDEGIDGVISEDRLGLEQVYLQAKRWVDRTVGRPDIQQFVGALHGKRARKGVFITTGSFSSEAEAYVRTIDPKVVLIDGDQLAEYMIDFGVGVSEERAFRIVRVDSDYFEV